MPPMTENTVVIAAFRHALFGLASPMLNNITSGGIGKKEDSANATAAR